MLLGDGLTGSPHLSTVSSLYGTSPRRAWAGPAARIHGSCLTGRHVEALRRRPDQTATTHVVALSRHGSDGCMAVGRPCRIRQSSTFPLVFRCSFSFLSLFRSQPLWLDSSRLTSGASACRTRRGEAWTATGRARGISGLVVSLPPPSPTRQGPTRSARPARATARAFHRTIVPTPRADDRT